jgi:hypothetical protein
MSKPCFPTLDPGLQVAFYYRFQTIRRLHLRDALRETVARLDLEALDGELREMVDARALQRTAAFGLRGELLFPAPLLLHSNPFLLGYYRLLYGLSQKEFYAKGPFGRFKSLEEAGRCSEPLRLLLRPLCASLIGTGERLVGGLDELNQDVIHELQLLTIGPQLRGSENTRIGQSATREVRDLILRIVAPHVCEQTDRTIVLRNSSDRIVLIEFFADPDVRITEKLPTGTRPTLSIEIKGGADVSNIHNRLGEAEKSHQKARNAGFFEFWTVLRADFTAESAKRESPTTSRFFNLDRICAPRTAEHREFRELLSSLIGIPSSD